MKKLSDLFKKNTVLKIFSVILAFLLWAYVQIVQNPEISYEVVEVPITITGEADINSQGFLVSTLPKNMKTNVTISATRSKIQLLDMSDLFAFVDVSQCNDTGDFVLPVKVRSNDSEITVMNKAPANISLYIDKIIKVTRPISISFDGTLDTDYYIDKDKVEITPKEATLKVPELLAEDISKVLVSVDMTNVSSNVNGNYKGIAIDESGEEVYSDSLTFVTESVNVKIPVLRKKVVSVYVDNAPQGANFTLLKDTVEIAGEENKIRYISSVSGSIKDYDPENPRDKYSVELKLPEGFVLTDTEDVTVNIEVPKTEETPPEQ